MGDSLGMVIVTGPANGTLTIEPDGTLLYTPTTGFFGTDSFTYRADDGSLLSDNLAVVTRLSCRLVSVVVQAAAGAVVIAVTIRAQAIRVVATQVMATQVTATPAAIPGGAHVRRRIG